MSLQRASFRGDSPDRDFQEVLQQFKQNGCNLLITGAVSEDVTAQATQRFLGAGDVDRKRVLALGDADRGTVRKRLPAGVTPDDPNVWLIDQRTDHRSVPDTARSDDTDLRSATRSVRPPSPTDATPTTGDQATDDEPTIDRLREEIITAINHFSETDEQLAPAELRLSVAELGRLAHDNDATAVARFVRSISAMVRGVRGMAHYHLVRPDDDELVDRLSSLFDARVELRQRDSLPTEQRWHVSEYEQTTDWVRL